jgi:single-stranded-DNA-specific exonuclease
MSILGKEWILPPDRKPDQTLWSSLLSARNIQDPGQFFSVTQITDLHDPFLFDDMQKATDRILQAVNAKDRIVIYGDYDVDGISGSAVLVHTLRLLGAQVSYRIPHRMEDGYGLHKKYVKELAGQNVSILITVDLGISCAAEVALAQENGIDVIITDHHTIPKNPDGTSNVPPAFATIHPQLSDEYPYKDLSGSGVAFKLASALLIATKNEDFIPALTDLTSLGTVADCVPLTGENRAIVKLGLEQMTKTKWDGLRAILRSAGVWGDQSFSSYTIGFQIGPRINASGRISNPYYALQTLLATGVEADQKSQKLDLLNKERQIMTRAIQEEAEAAVDTSHSIIIAAGQGWSSGIVGLIAGRLQEKYGKPAFIMEDRGDTLVGSARSLPGFHAVEALRQAAHLMENFGGHEQAAGFHLKKSNQAAFTKTLQDYATNFMAKNPIRAKIQIDAKILPGEANSETCQKITNFEPFGIANPNPTFLLEDVKVISTKPVGQQKSHLKFTIKHGTGQTADFIDGIAFNFAQHEQALKSAKRLISSLELNKWNGQVTPQLKLIDCS